jgi:hypothetical protein
MSDDETRPIEPDAPTSPPATSTPSAAGHEEAPAQPVGQAHPAYALHPQYAGYPAYAAPQRPRFADQVLGMRAVVATALACLVVGGLSGFVLGHAAARDDGRFGNGPGGGFFQQGGGFPGGPNDAPNQQFGQGGR